MHTTANRIKQDQVKDVRMNPRFKKFFQCKKYKLIREAKVTAKEAEKLLIDQWIEMSEQDKLQYDPSKDQGQENINKSTKSAIPTKEKDPESATTPLSRKHSQHSNSDFDTSKNNGQEPNKFVNVGSSQLCLPSHLTPQFIQNTAEKPNDPHSFMKTQRVNGIQASSSHTKNICSFIHQQHVDMVALNQPKNLNKFKIPVSFTDFPDSEDEDSQIQIFTPEFLLYNKKKELQLKNASKTAAKLSNMNNVMYQNEKTSKEIIKEQNSQIKTNKEKLNEVRSKNSEIEASFVKLFTNQKLPTKPDLRIGENPLEYLKELTKILNGNDHNNFKAKVLKRLNK